MKKLIALMLVVFMCLGAFVACGGDEDETSSESSSESVSESVSQSESQSESTPTEPGEIEDDTSNDNEVEF